MEANGLFSTIFTILSYIIRVFLPFLALLIVYQCYTSMRRHRRSDQPLITLYNLATHEAVPVVYWENSLGRSKTSDIILQDPTVSRDHAVLERRDEGWFICDTASKSGILVNGKAVERRSPVYVDDVISLGTTSLKLCRAQEGVRQRSSWFFDKRKSEGNLSPAALLFLTTLFHLFMLIPLLMQENTFHPEPLLPFALFTAAAWIFYFVTFRLIKRVSFELETLAIFLSGIGILLIAGVDVNETYTQIVALLIGMALYCCILWFIEDPDRVMRWRLWITLGALGLLAVNLVFGSIRGGAQNWIIIGPISIQPSEFVKIALIFVGSSTLNRLQTAKNLTEFIGFSAICIGALFLMGDFGTACIFFVTFLIIAFIRSGDIRTIIFIIAAAALGAFIILQFKPYIANRFAAWGHVWEYADSLGYQQTHVLSYSASGGLFGLGLGNGNLKYVAAANSDLVFGMMCEELGVLVALVAAVSIAFLAMYACTVTSKSRSTFYSIAACAAGGLLVFQSCLNIFGATDILPLTGVTLPFVSMGGSSLMACWGLLAFIKAADERTYAARRKKA